MENVRNLSFDLLKGFLIILVITGHILPGNANEGLRGIIYYSHMPLFLGVTGYFIKSESLNLTVRSLIKKIQYKNDYSIFSCIYYLHIILYDILHWISQHTSKTFYRICHLPFLSLMVHSCSYHFHTLHKVIKQQFKSDFRNIFPLININYRMVCRWKKH